MFAGILSFFSFRENGGNEIDQFVNELIEKEGLKANDEAPKSVLLRRLAFDITGLPAPKHLAEAYLNDNSDKAYNWLVDSLLAQPSYGEKWAQTWLDLARYADTKGYERDTKRNIWAYRDWVIKAYNEDMPYNRFITEQLAGDLLPNAGDSQLLATAFLRNSMTNDEGGTDNEEFRVAAVIDRVNTHWSVLQSSSFNCVQCHSHPYDPFRHEDYYKYMAFFNQTADVDSYEDYPTLKHFPDSLQQQYHLLNDWLAKNTNEASRAYWTHFVKTWQPAYNFLTSDAYIKAAQIDNKWLGLRPGGSVRMPQVKFDGAKQLLIRYKVDKPGAQLRIRLASLSGKILHSIKLDSTSGKYRNLSLPLPELQGVQPLYFEGTQAGIDPNAYLISFQWMALLPDFPKGKNQNNQEAKRWFDNLNNYYSFDSATPISTENPAYMQRPNFVFVRGNWLAPGTKVQPDIPGVFGGLPKHLPKNRLGLARWMCSPQNPLTARTAVNRVWEQLFGTGLVETLEDFGTQGLSPSNQALLDWLAYEYMSSDRWSQKALLRKIFLSKTYRRNAAASTEQLEKDPYNRFWARGPRLRMSGEQLRDQALALSGLLNSKMYGKPVYPSQPEGIWSSPYDNLRYEISDGDERYRRSIYTFWKRTSPYPLHINFDANSREVCVVRRIRSNTPLQALNTLNDPQFIEAATAWALKLEREMHGAVGAQIKAAYEQAIGQVIEPNKLSILLSLYHSAYKSFQKQPAEAYRFTKFCADDHLLPNNLNHTAAMALVLNSLLNLDEMLVRR